MILENYLEWRGVNLGNQTGNYCKCPDRGGSNYRGRGKETNLGDILEIESIEFGYRLHVEAEKRGAENNSQVSGMSKVWVVFI